MKYDDGLTKASVQVTNSLIARILAKHMERRKLMSSGDFSSLE